MTGQVIRSTSEIDRLSDEQIDSCTTELVRVLALGRIVTAHVDRFDSLNALVLSAGVGSAGTIAGYPMKRYDKSLAVNLRAPFLLLQHALPLLRATASDDPRRGAKVVTPSPSPAYVDTEMSAWIHDQVPPEQMLMVNDVVEMVDGLLRLSSRPVIPKIVMTRAGTDGSRA